MFNSADKWTQSQKQRAKILFGAYPDIQQAYSLTNSLRQIFNKNTIKDTARLSLARWYDKLEKAGFKSFNIIGNTLYENSDKVLNLFTNRATNALENPLMPKSKLLEQT